MSDVSDDDLKPVTAEERQRLCDLASKATRIPWSLKMSTLGDGLVSENQAYVMAAAGLAVRLQCDLVRVELERDYRGKLASMWIDAVLSLSEDSDATCASSVLEELRARKDEIAGLRRLLATALDLGIETDCNLEQPCGDCRACRFQAALEPYRPDEEEKVPRG